MTLNTRACADDVNALVLQSVIRWFSLTLTIHSEDTVARLLSARSWTVLAAAAITQKRGI